MRRSSFQMTRLSTLAAALLFRVAMLSSASFCNFLAFGVLVLSSSSSSPPFSGAAAGAAGLTELRSPSGQNPEMWFLHKIVTSTSSSSSSSAEAKRDEDEAKSFSPDAQRHGRRPHVTQQPPLSPSRSAGRPTNPTDADTDADVGNDFPEDLAGAPTHWHERSWRIPAWYLRGRRGFRGRGSGNGFSDQFRRRGSPPVAPRHQLPREALLSREPPTHRIRADPRARQQLDMYGGRREPPESRDLERPAPGSGTTSSRRDFPTDKLLERETELVPPATRRTDMYSRRKSFPEKSLENQDRGGNRLDSTDDRLRTLLEKHFLQQTKFYQQILDRINAATSSRSGDPERSPPSFPPRNGWKGIPSGKLPGTRTDSETPSARSLPEDAEFPPRSGKPSPARSRPADGSDDLYSIDEHLRSLRRSLESTSGSSSTRRLLRNSDFLPLVPLLSSRTSFPVVQRRRTKPPSSSLLPRSPLFDRDQPVGGAAGTAADPGAEQKAELRFLPPEAVSRDSERDDANGAGRRIRQEPKFQRSLESQGYIIPDFSGRRISIESEAEVLRPRGVSAGNSQQNNVNNNNNNRQQQGATPSLVTPLPASPSRARAPAAGQPVISTSGVVAGAAPETSTPSPAPAPAPAPFSPSPPIVTGAAPIQPPYADGLLKPTTVANRQHQPQQPALEDMARNIIRGVISKMDNRNDDNGSQLRALIEIMRSKPRFLTPSDFTERERGLIYARNLPPANEDPTEVFGIRNAEFFRTASFGDILVLHALVPTRGDGGRSSTLETVVVDLPEVVRPVLPLPNGLPSSRSNSLRDGVVPSERLDNVPARKKQTTEPFATIELRRPFKQSLENATGGQQTGGGDGATRLQFTQPQELQVRDDNREGRAAAARLLAREQQARILSAAPRFHEPEEKLQERGRKFVSSPLLQAGGSSSVSDPDVAQMRSANIELSSFGVGEGGGVGGANSIGDQIEKSEDPMRILAPEDSTERLSGGTF